MNDDKQSKIMSVNSLIALCYILDDYKKLDKSLKETLTYKNSVKICNDLNEISQNPYKRGGRTVREIYNKNKHTIDTIAQYTNVSSFLHYNDAWHKNAHSRSSDKYDLDYFYDYITNNKTKLGQIRSVLTRIKKIGIRKLELDENLDFSKNIYQINRDFNNNKKLYYLDNIVVIPNYEKDKVIYKTTDSPYEITTKPDSFAWANMTEDISEYDLNIKLNDLTFNKNRLPEKINKSIIFDNLLYLKRRINDACNCIINNVNLDLDIEALKNQYDKVVKDLIKTEDIENKEYVHQILMNLSEQINLLEGVCDNHKEKIIKNNDNISKKDLETEKINQKLLRNNKCFI